MKARRWRGLGRFGRVDLYGLCITMVMLAMPGTGLGGESPDGPEHIIEYLTLDEALGKAFADADSLWQVEWAPDDKERRRIERRLGWRLADSTFTIHQGARGDEHLGYAVVGDEIGLYRPITFLTKVGANHKVESVHVMVYRESRGGEVRRSRFLRQYKSKSIKSPIRINRDIIGVTGATLSVRAMNAGVKKALAVVATAFPEKVN